MCGYSDVTSRGAARPGCRHFGMTPFYDRKPTPLICAKDFFFVFGPHPHSDQKTHSIPGEDLFLSSSIFGPKPT